MRKRDKMSDTSFYTFTLLVKLGYLVVKITKYVWAENVLTARLYATQYIKEYISDNLYDSKEVLTSFEVKYVVGNYTYYIGYESVFHLSFLTELGRLSVVDDIINHS